MRYGKSQDYWIENQAQAISTALKSAYREGQENMKNRVREAIYQVSLNWPNGKTLAQAIEGLEVL